MSLSSIISFAFAAVGVLFLALGIAAFRRRRTLRGALGVLCSVLFLAIAGLGALVSLGTQGYRALTREDRAAMITTVPTGEGAFEARIRFSDGREERFALAGDEVYVDAHILKWHPIANLFGVHTGYELDRVAGRYIDIQDERAKPRTVYSLKQPKRFDIFNLARRYTILAPLVDAEYGSATFIQARRPAQFELRVSTSGLLIRKIGEVEP